MSTVYYARWVMLPSGEILTNGAVAVSGDTISSVGTRSSVKRATGDRLVNLGEVLLLPGLINMHSHLEEGVVRGVFRNPDEPFSTWIAKKTSRLKQCPVESVLGAVRLGVRESLANGITTVVDSSRTSASLLVLKEEPIRSWVIQEIHDEESVRSGEASESVVKMKRLVANSPRIHLGIGPYSLFSLSPQSQRHLIDLARDNQLLWTSHLAESSEELQAFSEQAGDLFFYITRNRAWQFGDTRLGPMHFALTRNLIPNGALLYHCNFAGSHELSLLGTKNVSVVLAPQYSIALGHKMLPLEIAIAKRVTACVGTESVVDSGSSSMFDELYQLKKMYPHIPAATLLSLVTTNPARSLRMTDKLGVISSGAYADLVGVSFAHDPREDILEELLSEDPAVRFVLVGGEEVIVDF